jgi:hypothetical protein
MAALSHMDKYGQRVLFVSSHDHAFRTLATWVQDEGGVKVNASERLVTFPTGSLIMFSSGGDSIVPKTRGCEWSMLATDLEEPLSEMAYEFLQTRLRLAPTLERHTVPLWSSNEISVYEVDL